MEFVPNTPADVLGAVNPRLLPLVAHDRAGFGGALVSDGIGVLLISLWGFRAGARWVWWTLFGAGLPGFAAALDKNGFKLAVFEQFIGDGHPIDLFAAIVQIFHPREDAAVLFEAEVLGLDAARGLQVDRIVQQDRTEHEPLGVQVRRESLF